MLDIFKIIIYNKENLSLNIKYRRNNLILTVQLIDFENIHIIIIYILKTLSDLIYQ